MMPRAGGCPAEGCSAEGCPARCTLASEQTLSEDLQGVGRAVLVGLEQGRAQGVADSSAHLGFAPQGLGRPRVLLPLLLRRLLLLR